MKKYLFLFNYKECKQQYRPEPLISRFRRDLDEICALLG
jgi:hypothetical protein